MSIKTTKRLALGVIASLVFAPFAAIAPASAAALTSTTAAQSVTVVPGVSSTIASVVFSGFVNGTADTVAVSAPTGPTGGTITFANVGGAVSVAGGANVITVGTGGTLTEAADSFGLADAAATAKTITATVSLPGTYTFTLGGSGTITVVARSLAYKTGDGAAVAPFSTGNGIAGPANTVTVTAFPTGVSSARALVTVTGSTILSGTNTPVIASGAASAVIANSGATDLVIATPTVGTITVSLFNETGNATGIFSATAANTVTITVNATASTGVFSAAKSTAVMGIAGNAPAVTTVDDVVPAADNKIGATAQAANILVTVLDVNGGAVTTGTVSAIISGTGLLGISNGTTRTAAKTGRAVSVATTGSGTHNNAVVSVWPDNTGAGVATVTISVGTTVLATKTVTFYGVAATYTATVVQGAVTANGAATTDAILVAAKDAAGVAVPGHTIYAFSSDTTKATVEASDATEATAIATSGARPATLVAATPVGSVAFNVTGIASKFGAVTISFGNATTLAASTVTTTATVIVSELKANSVVLTTNKATYLPGELVTLTLTAKDKNGNPIADGPGTALLTGALTASQSITSTLFGTAVPTKTGVATATFYAPLVEGTVVLSGKVGVAGTYVETLYAGTAITLSIPVAKPVAPVVVPPVVYDKPTLSFVKNRGRIILSGTAVDGEGDIIIYVKKVGTTAWKERAKTLEVAAPGDFNGQIKAPKGNVLIRVKQEGTGLFSNQIIVVK